MEKLKYACLLGCCLALATCRSARHPEVGNAYLSRYLPSTSDSAVAGREKALPAQADGLNRRRVQEAVDPEGGGSWGDILRNIIIYYRK